MLFIYRISGAVTNLKMGAPLKRWKNFIWSCPSTFWL